MDVERALIASVLKTDQLQEVLHRQIEPPHFAGLPIEGEPAPVDVWEWLVAHHRRYRAVPSMDLFRRRWPRFTLVETPDPLEAVIDEFVKTAKRRAFIEEIRSLGRIADRWDMVGEAEVHMMESARNLARLVPTSQVHRFSESLARRDRYIKRTKEGKIPGVSLFFQELDDLTFGVQPNEVAIIEGFLGIGKSTTTIMMAANSYFEKNETPLFMSLEMDGEKLANKWDAYAAKISYRALKRLELGEGDLEMWEKIGEKAANSKFEKDIIVIDDIWKPTIDRIYSEIERWSPRWTVIDTIDEIRAPTHLRTVWEQQAHAARELKGITRATKKSIIGVAQAGRAAEQEGATIGNLAGSIDIGRKADIVIGLHADDQMKKMGKMEVRALKIRDDEGTGRKFHYKWDVANLTARPWQPSDATPAVREIS